MALVAGRQTSWGLLAGLAGLVGVQACTAGDDPTALDLPLDALLAAVGAEVVLPGLATVEDRLQDLDTALAAWSDGTGSLTDSQDAWVDAFTAWQALEPVQVGPAGDSVNVIAGEDLRDELYSWPTVNGCRIDQETTEEAWDAPEYFADNLVNSYGLDALEHLLFASLDNSCPSQTGIDEAWDALGDEGVTANRQAFARALTAGALDVVSTLQERWETTGDDFGSLLTASTADSPYASESEAFSAVFDALFYLELTTKDRKLAQPLGLKDCSEPQCPDDVEALTSGAGVAAIAANLDGFQRLFTGGEGAGFDDLLAELGEEALSDELLAALTTAQATANSLTGPLDLLVVDDTASVEALYEDIKAVTDLLKGDLLTVLALQVPDEASGDND